MSSLLKVTPQDNIEFPLVLYTPLNANLFLENLSGEHVAFKIKTTAPKGYLVRPSTGTIKPRESLTVQIILQPLSEVPNVVNDRFLVQCTAIANDELVSKDFWTTLDKACIQDHRLNVTFKKDIGLNIQTNQSNVGVPPHIAAKILTPLGANASVTELRQKYEELVSYCLATEKQKEALVKDNEKLRQLLHLGPNETSSGSKWPLEGWHLPVMVIILVIILKALGYW